MYKAVNEVVPWSVEFKWPEREADYLQPSSLNKTNRTYCHSNLIRLWHRDKSFAFIGMRQYFINTSYANICIPLHESSAYFD
jgi:hypothetical protein